MFPGKTYSGPLFFSLSENVNLQSIATHAWAYPMLEVLHLLGVSLILGNLALVELRVLGLGRSLPIAPLARVALPIVLTGALLCVVSGLLMFASQAGEFLANRLFTLKMILLALAATNALWFHLRGSLQKLDLVARLSALVSLAIWLAVLSLGRWIAYA